METVTGLPNVTTESTIEYTYNNSWIDGVCSKQEAN
jgi:hypothetical protein